MANQHSQDFRISVEARYGMDVIDVLLHFQGREMTYLESANECGFCVRTVRRWCYRYSIQLPRPIRSYFKLLSKKRSSKTFLDRFYDHRINSTNCLSRRWI